MSTHVWRRLTRIGSAWMLVLTLCGACSTAPTEQPRSPSPAASSGGGPAPTAYPPSERAARDCLPEPSRCGYPDHTNTGVPSSTKLRSSGSVTADQDGQIIDGLDVTGEINVEADDVVIKNSRVTGGRGAGNPDWVVVMRPGAENLRIESSELRTPSGSAQDIACLLNIGNGRPTVVGVNIHGCSAGVSSGGGVVVNSYIHDMAEIAGRSHDVGIASNGGGGMEIRHNTVINQLGQTAAVAFYQDFAPQANNLVRDNLLAGGGYCLYGGAGGKGPTRNLKFLDNRLSQAHFPTCGAYGVMASYAADDPDNEFSGNYWDETGHDVTIG